MQISYLHIHKFQNISQCSMIQFWWSLYNNYLGSPRIWFTMVILLLIHQHKIGFFNLMQSYTNYITQPNMFSSECGSHWSTKVPSFIPYKNRELHTCPNFCEQSCSPSWCMCVCGGREAIVIQFFKDLVPAIMTSAKNTRVIL